MQKIRLQHPRDAVSCLIGARSSGVGTSSSVSELPIRGDLLGRKNSGVRRLRHHIMRSW